MRTTENYKEIIDQVSKLSVEELITEFNALVGNNGWNSARAAHDKALIDSLIEKGIDVSSVYDGKVISFKNKVTLNESKHKLEIS